MEQGVPQLTEPLAWRRTGNPYFPSATNVNGNWWVLRVNNFPDHPLWTLFINGERRCDVEGIPDGEDPPNWGHPAADQLPRLDPATTARVLAPVERHVAYGSEVGRACDNPFCCG
jgi:hypothetical protein